MPRMARSAPRSRIVSICSSVRSPPPNCTGIFRALKNGFRDFQMRRLAGERAIQIHEMKTRRPLRLPVESHRHGIATVLSRPGSHAFLQPDALPPLQVYAGSAYCLESRRTFAPPRKVLRGLKGLQPKIMALYMNADCLARKYASLA